MLKLANCLQSAANLVETDVDITEEQPKVQGVFLWTTMYTEYTETRPAIKIAL